MEHAHSDKQKAARERLRLKGNLWVTEAVCGVAPGITFRVRRAEG